jgi:glutamate-1-semialdehyde 2,1-aminomutase
MQPHRQVHRRLPKTTSPIDSTRVQTLIADEWNLYTTATKGSESEISTAKDSSPLGVTSSFQYWDPYPISITSARGAWMYDVDDRAMLDLSMGFGAMLVGHLNPRVVDEIRQTLEVGTLFVTPSPIARDASERLCKRFDIDLVRFTNSGTESTMYAVRTARAYTGKNAVVKVEGGYHGSYDPLMVSAKPGIAEAGSEDNPNSVTPYGAVPGDVFVVPYNNAEVLERVFSQHKDEIACFVIEPVLENIGIVVPDEGYLERVRELCDSYGIVLIFDEVKTGLTAGYRGAAHRLGVTPDLITLAKSIGGGTPIAAFGGKREIMNTLIDGRMLHFGTFNGNPLALAGVRAVDAVVTEEAIAHAESLNMQALSRISDIIDEYELPAHTVGFGVKGCVTWSKDPVRNYRDYKATDFEVAELSWLFSLNRNIITPPGLDEQWLISLAHGQAEIDLLVENFRELAVALRG